MQKLYEEFILALERQDRELAVQLCLQALNSQQISVTSLYLEVLTPALNRLVFSENEEDAMIWREHNQSSLVRTIIESAFVYVMAERRSLGRETDKKVLVVCPESEEHELGARMAADLFTIWGFQTTFIGARTPAGTLIKAMEAVRPDILTFSITNYYNLVPAKRMIAQIRKQFTYTYQIFAGGNACLNHENACEILEVDRILTSLLDIETIRKELNA